MKELKKISFLIPTLGTRYSELKRLFDSLKEQSNREFEVIVVVQGNYQVVEELCLEYINFYNVQCIRDYKTGLSRARNLGIPNCTGDIIVLSDDDCWYPVDAVQKICCFFNEDECDILLTQIYDTTKNIYYKEYSNNKQNVRSEFSLLSRSSIEIAFKREAVKETFDELFGLGADYVCGEEVDFLLRTSRTGIKIVYIPSITVYHEKKNQMKKSNRIIAKGALYAKNFNIIVGLLVCLRDLIIKKENNFKHFVKGYYEYSKRKN